MLTFKNGERKELLNLKGISTVDFEKRGLIIDRETKILEPRGQLIFKKLYFLLAITYDHYN